MFLCRPNYRKVLFTRTNNIPVYDKTRGAFRALPKHTLKGLPDIIVIKQGRFIWLEVKTKVGRLLVEFGRRAKEHGADYQVVRSIDDDRRLGL